MKPRAFRACALSVLACAVLLTAIGATASTVASFQPQVRFQKSSVPGGIIRADISSATPIDSVSVCVQDGKGKTVSRGVAFPANGSLPAADWFCLAAVASTVAPGEYHLVLDAKSGSGAFHANNAVVVAPVSFASEEIPLDQSLTDLREAPDPRKTAESAELGAILARVDEWDVFEPGPFLRPVEPLRKSAGYGDRRLYRYSNTHTEQSVHDGVDYALPQGSPVFACGAGKVVMAQNRILTGNTVVIEHLPGLYSLYYHMSEIRTQKGASVEKGQLVGLVGMTGFATGPHLHWQIQLGGIAVDPESLLVAPIVEALGE